MTVATRTGFELDAAIESYRRNQRTRLAEQTLDRIDMPRLRQLSVALVRLLADSGMRRGEVAGLTVADLHLDGEGLILLRGDTSKSRRGRIVPLSREALGALDRYLRVRHSHPHAALPCLWLGKRGRLTDSGILQIVERRGRQAGIPGLHPHRFRHTFAHSMLVRGATEGAVAALAGWKDRAMLARYGRSAAVERAVAEFRRLDAG